MGYPGEDLKNQSYPYADPTEDSPVFRELCELAYRQDPVRAKDCLLRMGYQRLAVELELDRQLGR